MRWRPISPPALPIALAERLVCIDGVVRVAMDGPPCAHPDALTETMIEPLRALGRETIHVRSQLFWRDASLRLEHGREDVESYLDWLDAAALSREVLEPIATAGAYLPSLRDPRTNRSTREAVRHTTANAILVVSGELLLGLGLPFDLAVHLTMSHAARARHTADEDAWTLPAFQRYDAATKPSEVADIVVRMDDSRHPAVRGLA